MSVSLYQGYVLAQQFLANEGGIKGDTETSTSTSASVTTARGSMTTTETSTTDMYDASGPAVLLAVDGGVMRIAADSSFDGTSAKDLPGAVLVNGDQKVTLASSSSSTTLYTASGSTLRNNEEELVASLFSNTGEDQTDLNSRKTTV
ncbi:hypothetical protein [Acetobacter oeni]|uniref:Uncharacterized protein n=1 Tax=Acetobacter oeni TaxID=304077 RepID=A0A511XH57_9PROT|nr:hypothetical protein [Acetobacter oeni]MBB3882393.1 hypothetical protein [Acetobacter oeni]NHO18508.1 hypothetical protein [Acetobacter oeni]GBR09383.1 hypothetical protein AA21952_2842 [Acetobacter oeni LMG 21952]GEN62251.1 hypothetical protein AOE01nite_04750 [Acetobacter oeni]